MSNTGSTAHTLKKTSNPLSETQAISYALPVIISVMLTTPIGIIQGIYAKYYGIALTTLAFIVLCSRIFDAASDPVVGYLSDQYRKKHGTRKPFVLVGMLLLLFCGYFLFVPPDQVSTTYIAVWFIAFYASYTVFQIPHMTWPCDIISESAQRTKLYSYRVMAGYCGAVLFYCIPLLPFFPTKDITPQTLKVTFFVAAVLALPLLFQAIRAVPAGKIPISPKDTETHPSRGQLLRASLQEIISNKPFLIFVGVFLFSSSAFGMWYGVIFIYVDAYLNMGDQFAEMFLIAFIIGIAVAPLWYRIALLFGKKSTYCVVITMIIASFIYTGALNPGETRFVELLLLKTLQTCGIVGAGILAPSMLADIADYAHWKTGVENSGTYFSVKVFFEKTAIALGAGLALGIAGWFGFVVTDTQFTPDSVWGLKMAIAWVPAALAVIALIFVVLSPIDERRHRIIKRRLEARLARSLALSQLDANSESKERLDSQQQEVPLNAS